MSLLAIIPAKKHSTRLPGKNMLEINGETLVHRAVKCAIDSNIFTSVIVSDDNYRSSPLLSMDGVESAAVVFDVLANEKYKFEVFCLLNPTSPCRTVEMLQRAHNEFKSKDLDCLWSMGKYGNHDGNFLFWKTIPFLRYISRSIIDGSHWARTDGIDINTQEDFDLAVKQIQSGVRSE